MQTGIGLLVQGRTHFSDAETFRQEKSEILKYALDLNDIPSEATFRQRFPSHSFMVNELFLMLGMLAYNVLRVIDAEVMQHVEAWPDFYRKRGERQQCRRVGSIIRDFILVASKVVKHAGRVTIKLTTSWPWTRVMQKVSLNL